MRGSGKGNTNPGLIPLSVQEIFAKIQSDQRRTYSVTVSYMEVSLTLNHSSFSYSVVLRRSTTSVLTI